MIDAFFWFPLFFLLGQAKAGLLGPRHKLYIIIFILNYYPSTMHFVATNRFSSLPLTPEFITGHCRLGIFASSSYSPDLFPEDLLLMVFDIP